MPKWTNDPHCIDCKTFKETDGKCLVRMKVENEELYNILDPILEKFIGVKVEFTLYKLVCCCEKFERYKAQNPVEVVLVKAMKGETLDEDEQELLDRVMGSLK